MHLDFRCPPELQSILPPPLPARVQLPMWVERMPKKAFAENLDIDVETIRSEKSFQASFEEGFVLRFACSVHVDRPGELRWDWVPPTMTMRNVPRSPVSMLDPAVIVGTPYYRRDKVLLSFSSFWTLDLPEGWNLLLMHPLNRLDTPFQTLSKIIKQPVGTPPDILEVHSLWVDEQYTGVLPRGMPFAQGFLIPDGFLSLQHSPLDLETITERNRYVRATTKSPLILQPIKRRRG